MQRHNLCTKSTKPVHVRCCFKYCRKWSPCCLLVTNNGTLYSVIKPFPILHLFQDLASVSVTCTCIQIDKPPVVYIFSNNKLTTTEQNVLERSAPAAKRIMLHIKNIMHANALPFYTPSTHACFFFEEGYVAYHIMQLKRLTLCTPLTFWVII